MACFHPNQLPSPRGDELFREVTLMACFHPNQLPSPRGDELFQAQGGQAKGEQGYRPLAGMNCFLINVRRFPTKRKLPSPRGDELFLFRKCFL